MYNYFDCWIGAPVGVWNTEGGKVGLNVSVEFE